MAFDYAAMGPEPFSINPPKSANETVVSVADFGATTDKSKCNGKAFMAAIEHCRKTGAAKLIAPKGVYYFNSGNHPKFDGLKDFTFDGQGSEFIFSTLKRFFVVEHCERAVFKNFTLDWNWEAGPLASWARAVEVPESGGYATFDFFDQDEVDTSLRMSDFAPVHPDRLKLGVRGLGDLHEWVMGKQEWLAKNRLRVYHNDRVQDLKWVNLREGMLYRVRHYVWDVTAFWYFSNSHFTIDNVTVYSAPGMAFIGGGDTHHWQIVNCKVTKRPGTFRPISVCADHCHINQSQGYFRLENCDFGYGGDDGINIHDTMIRAEYTDAPRVLKVNPAMPHVTRLSPGDLIEFRRPDFSLTPFKAEVTEVCCHPGTMLADLTLDRPVPREYGEYLFGLNRRYGSNNFYIRNNAFHSNRARGVLIQASRGLIEGNHFYDIQAPAAMIETLVEQCEAPRWAEGYGVNGLIFRNNLIENCDESRWERGMIQMKASLPLGHTDYPVFQNVLFEDNTIINSPRTVFYLSSCKGVTVRNNMIINPNTAKEAEPTATIEVFNGADVTIEGNTRHCLVPAYGNSVFAETKSTSNIVVKDNKGFE